MVALMGDAPGISRQLRLFVIWGSVGSTRGAGRSGATLKKRHTGDLMACGARVGLRTEQELVQGLAHLFEAVGEVVKVGGCVAGQALQQCLLLP